MNYPYGRLSSFYFFFFASVGALTPYWGLYLQHRGFGPREIGELTAILLATKIVSPNLWAWIAGNFGQTLPVVRLGAMLALIMFSGLYWASAFWCIAAVMFGFSFFWNAVLPQMEAVTLRYLGEHSDKYGTIRLWGSLGFIVFVLAMGALVERHGPGVMLPTVGLALLGVCLATMTFGEPAHNRPAGCGMRFRDMLVQPGVAMLLLCCLLMQASHAPFYAFFSIYLSDYGYSKGVIGALWAFGTICEIVVFYVMHRLHKNFSLVSVLLFSFVVTAIRWVLVANFVQYPWVIALTQAMHAVTFGAYHASAVQLIREMFQEPYQHRGLALYGSVSFGVGGALGSLYSGFLWDSAGPSLTFVVASVVALLGAILVCRIKSPLSNPV